MDDPRAALAIYRAAEHGENTAYLLSDQLRIVRVNDAWNAFAQANGGAEMAERWGRGSEVLAAISGELREFYRALFERALRTGDPQELDYDCSTDQQYRLYRMRVIPVSHSFLVVTHSLRVERAHDGANTAPVDADYVHDGVIRMCAHCRRVRHVGGTERWDWVPSYVTLKRPDISHGLCPTCVPLFDVV